ncbi:MAG TPA: xanthine dehydrogenase family protein molybdopterin-binding subunit [Candidatus Entotheonella sp.]
MESQRQEHVVGASVPRVDAQAKVTGQAVFITDLHIPGMAHAKLWRSPLPHARIRGIDTSAAAAAPGVLAILTAADFAGEDLFFGPAYKDQSILAIDRVRYAGEPVAAVVALSEREAEAALQWLDVDLAELPAVTTLDAALAPGAPLLHETPRLAGHFRDLSNLRPIPGTNICHHFHYERGDVDQGFAESDHIFEDEFTFPMVHHYSMEPHVSIAQAEADHITVWAATQHPFPVRKELADIFKLPLSRVQVIVPYLGGAYGNKSYTKLEPLTVALSRRVGRPVRLAFSVEESFKIVRRAAARVRIKTGMRHDGTMVARHCTAYYQIGAYADVGPRVVQKAGYTAGGPYRIPHLHIDTHAVYSNTVNSVAFRGYGVPQLAWAYESQMDMMAERLGLDALDIRLKNLLHRGEPFAPGDLPIDCDFHGSLKRAAEAIGWHQPTPAGRGRGLACVIKAPLAPSVSTAMVRMHADGSVTLLAGTIEFGQGARTVLPQIVAEELALPIAWVRLAQPEFGMSPYDQATSSSRSTTLVGLALQRAAQDLRAQLLTLAAGQLQLPQDRLTLRQGAVEGPEIRRPYADLLQHHFGMPGGELIGRGVYRGESGAPLGGVAPFWEVSLAAAEVSADAETGQIHLHRYISIADVGKAINPLQCEAQEEGGVMMGIGHTFFEQMVYADGQLLNPSLIDYRIPAMSDLPEEFRSILIENGDGPGPFGAKGIGESGLMPTAPAIANALARATGLRLKVLPLTPERIRQAMRDKTLGH